LERGRKTDLTQQGGARVEGKRLDGKKVLIVDDEPDVLETLGQLLFMCDLRKALSFDEARELLEREKLDMAVLDIMGVDGYKLLEIAKKRNVLAVMLTAHALSVEDTIRSFKNGAASYLPKDEMAHIASFLEELLEDKERGGHFGSRWLERWGEYYDKKFGPDWRDEDKEFWEKFQYWI
jgi:DNA-binding NtrC family response regulator